MFLLWKIRDFFLGRLPVRRKNNKSIKRILNSRKWRVVDIRPRAEYLGERLSTSMSMPIIRFDSLFRKNISKNDRVLLVCRNGYQSAMKFHKLYEEGYDIFILKDGLNGIKKSKDKSLIFVERKENG